MSARRPTLETNASPDRGAAMANAAAALIASGRDAWLESHKATAPAGKGWLQ